MHAYEGPTTLGRCFFFSIGFSPNVAQELQVKTPWVHADVMFWAKRSTRSQTRDPT